MGAQGSCDEITNWHAHIYFDPDEAQSARALCEALRDALHVPMGRVHAVPVGPHPRGSCQMSVESAQLGVAIEWLVRHRGHFTVFVHGLSGDELHDHMALAMWLGPSEPLDLSKLN